MRVLPGMGLVHAVNRCCRLANRGGLAGKLIAYPLLLFVGLCALGGIAVTILALLLILPTIAVSAFYAGNWAGGLAAAAGGIFTTLLGISMLVELRDL